MPRFAESKRAGDLALGAENPYLDMVQKLESFLPMATGYYRAEDYNGVGWANTMDVSVYRAGGVVWRV